ncbi:uncharacterized protein LOC144114732 [Amblyomma americanum]
MVKVKTKKGKTCELEVLETDVICDQYIPTPPVTLTDRLRILGYEPADFTNDGGPRNIGLLIGSDHIWELTTGRSTKIDGKLRAVETAVGWTIQGPVQGIDEGPHCMQTITLRTSVTEISTTDILTKFWTLESIGINDNEAKTGKNAAVEFFEDTVQLKGGRYEVALPWKPVTALEDNREVALRRLHQLTRRLQNSTELLNDYDAAIRQYSALNMAEIVETKDSGANTVYHMPHQAVIRGDHKLRVVFDASSHNRSAKSLNDNLESGPNLTADLVGMLLNFRRHKIALVADIEQAFLQISVRPEDRDSLRFLWYETKPEPGGPLPPILTWRMKRVPFGTTASPFLLSATLQHHLKNTEEQFPITASRLQRSLYVDDILMGAENEQAALNLYNEANAIFGAASMQLHKWASNSEKLCQRFQQDSKGAKPLGYLSGVLKVLGLTWEPSTDLLTFCPCTDRISTTEPPTKRSVLQTTARIYDPLGWLSPFIVRAKVLFQQLWRLNIEWDDALPEGIAAEWSKWLDELSYLPEVKVPRYSDSTQRKILGDWRKTAGKENSQGVRYLSALPRTTSQRGLRATSKGQNNRGSPVSSDWS